MLRTKWISALPAGLVVLWVGCTTGGPAPVVPASPEEAVEVALAVAPSPAAAYREDPEAVTRGGGLFRAVCTGYCHSTRPADRVAPDLFDCVWKHGSSDLDIHRVVLEGVPDTQMQAFVGKLPDDEVWKIIAFLRARSRCQS